MSTSKAAPYHGTKNMRGLKHMNLENEVYNLPSSYMGAHIPADDTEGECSSSI